MSSPHRTDSSGAAAALVELLRAAPLRLRRVCLEKVWGGRALEEVLGIQLDRPGPIGETWELVDRADEQSIVADGPLAGRALGDLVREARAALLGSSPSTPDGRFPLLVKFLDATAPLSVQVHPDDDGARRQGGTSEPKTEAWYFLRGGGEVWCGFRPGVDRAAFESALESGLCADLLVRHPVAGGSALTVRGGTVHAIGAGVTLLEVQQNSDTTYRLDDWGRVGLDGKPRDLHRALGLEVAHFGVAAPATVDASGATGGTAAEPARASTSARVAAPERASTPGRRVLLARTEHFELEALDLAGEPLDLHTGGRFQIYVGVGGSAILSAPNSGVATRLGIGDLLLVPAVLGPHTLVADLDGRAPRREASTARSGGPTSEETARVIRLAVPAQ